MEEEEDRLLVDYIYKTIPLHQTSNLDPKVRSE